MGWTWLGLIVLVLGYVFIFNPALLSVEYMATVLAPYRNYIGWIYLGLLIGRGFFMLPSTPFLFLGIFLFPGYRFFIVCATTGSILLSAIFFYFFSERMGWHHYFNRKFPKKMGNIETQLKKPTAIWLVVFWAFFPIVPTDLVCYAAGMVRMPFRILLTGVFLGQFPLLLLYAYLSGYFF